MPKTKPGEALGEPPNVILNEYVTLPEAAQQHNMPSLRTLQRRAREKRLDGLVRFGRKVLLHVPTFRAGLLAQHNEPKRVRRRR